MAEHPPVFDEVFRSLVHAGEDSGNLADVLKSLFETLKWQDELASQTKKLLMYPAFMGVVVIAVFFFMMIYLVPKLTSFIRNMGQVIPPQTKFLMFISDVFVHYWYLIVTVPCLIILGLNFLIRTNPAARYRFDDIKLRLPVLGEILKKIILARFASTFAMMYASGVSIMDTIHTTERVVGNVVIREAIERAGVLIEEGQNITLAFQSVGMFPPLVIRMLRVGENSGGLDIALGNVAYFFSRDVKESIERLQTMIEPAMTVIVGLILGWVMMSVLGPIYDLITKLKT
jgi:type IV pilus assembly protein PilC